MTVVQESGVQTFTLGVEKDFEGWCDVRAFRGPKTLFVKNAGANSIKVRVYQGSFNPANLQLPKFKGRIDYDMAIFTVSAGQEKRLPIYDDDDSEVLKVTGEALIGNTTASHKITGPMPLGKTFEK